MDNMGSTIPCLVVWKLLGIIEKKGVKIITFTLSRKFKFHFSLNLFCLDVAVVVGVKNFLRTNFLLLYEITIALICSFSLSISLEKKIFWRWNRWSMFDRYSQYCPIAKKMPQFFFLFTRSWMAFFRFKNFEMLEFHVRA